MLTNARLVVHAAEETVSILRVVSNVNAVTEDLLVKTEQNASILMSALFKEIHVATLEDVKTCWENSFAFVTLVTHQMQRNKAVTILMSAYSTTVDANITATIQLEVENAAVMKVTFLLWTDAHALISMNVLNTWIDVMEVVVKTLLEHSDATVLMDLSPLMI
jgi:hypothetical protein